MCLRVRMVADGMVRKRGLIVWGGGWEEYAEDILEVAGRGLACP